jgi:hypothetical protein
MHTSTVEAGARQDARGMRAGTMPCGAAAPQANKPKPTLVVAAPAVRSAGQEARANRGFDARRVQPLQGQQAGRVAMLDEHVGQPQVQQR